MASDELKPIWVPRPRPPRDCELDRFLDYLRASCALNFDSYQELWQFSVEHLEAFWEICWRYFAILGDRPALLAEAEVPLPEELNQLVLTSHDMPGFRFYPGCKINFAENAFNSFKGSAKVISISETRPETAVIPADELWKQVARVADGLRQLGVGKGDRVVGYLPNIEETLIAFLASASIGAIWSCCSPDFGVSSVIDRFSQIEPKVLFGVNGYVYSSKAQLRTSVVEELVRKLPSLVAVVMVDYLASAATIDIEPSLKRDWSEFGRLGTELRFERVEFSDPLWVLYSSGTTGLPKAIVHGHGGVILELTKQMAFQQDLHAGSRFFWFTTTGWMMWNFLVGGMLVGSDIVLFDGNPGYPSLRLLWQYIGNLGISVFGISAAFVSNCMNSGLKLDDLDLSSLESVCSTGAPLSLEGFHWLRDQLGGNIQIVSESGGTDVCTAFLAASPLSPTFAGKISARSLGASVQSYSPDGVTRYGEVGELVVTEPMPSMPVFLWNDNTGARLRASYFDRFPGVWSHGDWIRIDEDGTSVIFGRSDSTLNRGGVRMGTAEFYRVIERFDQVSDSLVVDTSAIGVEGELIVFLVLKGPEILSDDLVDRMRVAIRSELSPRHVPDRWIAIPEVPRTLNGKKVEVPVKRMLLGEAVSDVTSVGSLANPESLTSIAKAIRGGDPETI